MAGVTQLAVLGCLNRREVAGGVDRVPGVRLPVAGVPVTGVCRLDVGPQVRPPCRVVLRRRNGCREHQDPASAPRASPVPSISAAWIRSPYRMRCAAALTVFPMLGAWRRSRSPGTARRAAGEAAATGADASGRHQYPASIDHSGACVRSARTWSRAPARPTSRRSRRPSPAADWQRPGRQRRPSPCRLHCLSSRCPRQVPASQAPPGARRRRGCAAGVAGRRSS